MARMVSEDFIGTCQWCFGEYKVNGSRNVVLHGYTRPGYGYTVGNCPGYDHTPFEYAHNLTDERIDSLKAGIENAKKQITLIDDGKVTKIKNPAFEPEDSKKWSGARMYGLGDENRKTHLTPEDRDFAYYMRQMKAQLESDIRFDQGIVDFLAEQVKKWQRKPVTGLDTPATGKERYLRGAYDPDKAAAAEDAAQRKAARDAKPGKITLTVYTNTPSYPSWEDEDARRAAIDSYYAREKELKLNLKAWTKETFPADKYWVGDVYSGDVERLRPDLRGKGNIAAAATKVDWKYLDKVLEMYPEGPMVHRRDNSAKDVRLYIDASVLGAEV